MPKQAIHRRALTGKRPARDVRSRDKTGTLGDVEGRDLTLLGRYLAARFLKPSGYKINGEQDRMRPTRLAVLKGGTGCVFEVVTRHKYTGKKEEKRRYQVPGETDDWIVIEIENEKYSLYLGKREDLSGKKKLGIRRKDLARRLRKEGLPLSASINIKSENLNPPQEIGNSLEWFRTHKGEPWEMAFIMIQFKDDERRQRTEAKICEAFEKSGITAVSAAEQKKNDTLLQNVKTFLYGCGYGVAVFEKIGQRDFNPNITWEAGFMEGLGRRVLLLKDKNLRYLPADLAGKLFEPFDPQKLKTVSAAVAKWSRDNVLPTLQQILTTPLAELLKDGDVRRIGAESSATPKRLPSRS